MIKLTQKTTKHSLEATIQMWSDILRMKHWTYRVSDHKPADGHLMEAAMNRLRRICNVRISEDVYKMEQHDANRVAVHEVLHPVFDGIMREFEHLIRRLPTEEQTEYTERSKCEVEQVVEQLSNVLYDLLLSPEYHQL